MFAVKVCSEVREAVGRSSKFAAREVQLVIGSFQILGPAKVWVVDEQRAVRGGKGRRVDNCKGKGPAHLDRAAFPKESGCQVGQSTLQGLHEFVSVSSTMEKQRCEMQRTMDDTQQAKGQFQRWVINQN